MPLPRLIEELDQALCAVPKPLQMALAALAAVALFTSWLFFVPRAYIDFSDLPVLNRISQPAGYGTDTLADMYEARVVLNSPRDMYTKELVDQTPEEARAWSKAASAPYPPTALFIDAALYWIGMKSGIGYYGMILLLAAYFHVAALYYCLQTRWYVFLLMALCGFFFSERFAYVQDCTYLIFLALVITALLLAKRRPSIAVGLTGVAIDVKLLPMFFLTNLTWMRRRQAAVLIGVVAAGLVLPYFLLPNYLYIYSFQSETRGGLWQTVGAIAVTLPFSYLLWRLQRRGQFDLEDRIGWSLVPVALFLAFNVNAARHLLVALLVPDKHAMRTSTAAIGIGIYALSGGSMSINSVLPLMTAALYAYLLWRSHQPGESATAAR